MILSPRIKQILLRRVLSVSCILNATMTAQNVGCLKGAVFGESPRECSAATSAGSGFCYRILRCQSLSLLLGQLKTEILWEARLVALDRFIEAKGRDRIEPGEVSVQDHALTTDAVDKTVQAREYFSFMLHVGRMAGAGRGQRESERESDGEE
jgi:hypothetical protein